METYNLDSAQLKRWRDSNDLVHHVPNSVGSVFSAREPYAVAAVNFAENGDDVDSTSKRWRKKPRLDIVKSTSDPKMDLDQVLSTTPMVRTFPNDENIAPTTEWWRHHQQQQQQEIPQSPNQTIPDECFVCSKRGTAQHQERLPLKPNTLLNYFPYRNSISASKSQRQQPLLPEFNDNRTQFQQCSFCDRYMCLSCTRSCQGCGESFCSLCSIVDYRNAAEERSFCLDCHASQTQTAQEACRQECVDYEMELD